MASYTRGQNVRFTITIKDVLDVLADPTTLTFEHKFPDGTTTTQTYQTDPEPTRDSIGVFHVDETLTNYGKHRYRWEAGGAVIGAVEKTFDVKPSAFSS